MDFDQQSYDGRKNSTFPNSSRRTIRLSDFGVSHIDAKTAYQYQKEEHHLIARRMKTGNLRIKAILDTMSKDELAPEENFKQLRQELSAHYKDDAFLKQWAGSFAKSSSNLRFHRA